MLNRNFLNAVLYPYATNSMSKTRSYRHIDNTYGTDNYGANSLLTNIFNNFSAVKEGSLSQGQFTFMLGSGNTAETIDDYTLANRIDESNFTIVSASVTDALQSSAKAEVYNNCKRVLNQIWSYSGSDEITINEIGLVCMSNWSSNKIMFDRTVLESPITVNNGDTFTIALTIGGKATVTVNP